MLYNHLIIDQNARVYAGEDEFSRKTVRDGECQSIWHKRRHRGFG